MPPLIFTAMPAEHANALQSGADDAYGRRPERMVSPGGGMPCRHCLDHIAEGPDMLVVAYRPFSLEEHTAEIRSQWALAYSFLLIRKKMQV